MKFAMGSIIVRRPQIVRAPIVVVFIVVIVSGLAFAGAFRGGEGWFVPQIPSVLAAAPYTIGLIVGSFCLAAFFGLGLRLIERSMNRSILITLVISCIPLYWIAIAVEILLALHGLSHKVLYVRSDSLGAFLTSQSVPAILLAIVQLPTVMHWLKERAPDYTIVQQLAGAFADAMPAAISGAIIVEVIYARHGAGHLFYSAIGRSHFARAEAFLLLSALTVFTVRLAIAIILSSQKKVADAV